MSYKRARAFVVMWLKDRGSGIAGVLHVSNLRWVTVETVYWVDFCPRCNLPYFWIYPINGYPINGFCCILDKSIQEIPRQTYTKDIQLQWVRHL